MLRTLGKLRLEGTDFSRPVPLLMLCYLTYEGGKHDREDLAELFFPFSPPDETTLSSQAQHIVDAIYEAKFTSSKVNLHLPPFSQSELNLDDLEAMFVSAHQLLKLNGFISNAEITGAKGNYQFAYTLTPSFFIQCKGLDPLSVSLNKLKSHLHNLSSIQPSLISKTSRFVESLTRLDLHDVRDAMRAGEVKLSFDYAPFLDRIESQLQKEKFQLGNRLAEWLERTRVEVGTELFRYFANRAVACRASDTLEARHCSLKALEISQSSQIDDAADEPFISLLSKIGHTALGAGLASTTHDTPRSRRSTSNLYAPHVAPHERKQRAWLLSQEHLGSLIDPQTTESQPESTPSLRAKYNADTYVETTDDQSLRTFLSSDNKCLLVLGKSGTGKTSLLCHSFLEKQKADSIAIFLSARLFTTPDVGKFLREQVWADLFRDPFPERTQISNATVYIDAVNEFSYSGNPVMLLHSIIKYVQDVDNATGPKIVFSCRVETWREYLEVYSTEPHGIDILNLAGFRTTCAKAELYQNYQRYYHLYPPKYSSLSSDVTQLIETPVLMRMIAETYSNRSERKTIRRIPKKLNYFEVFMLLTDYKREDALRLLAPNEPKKALFDEALQQCLLEFAALMYKKVTGSMSGSHAESDTTDAIDAAHLNGSQFATYLAPFSEQSSVSPFQALVQLNLISETTITKLNFWGRPSSVVAYKFFHDQYTQFCLAAVLGETVLGSLAECNLSHDSPELHELGDRLSDLLGEAGQTPLIGGAVEHWLHANISTGESVSFPIPLLDLLASQEAGAVFYFVASFLHGLVDKNVLTPRKLYRLLFKHCSLALKIVLANHLFELWPNISRRQLTAFLSTLDNQRDGEVLRALSDNFVELFNVYPYEVIRLLDTTLKGGEDFPKALKHVVVSRSEAFNHAAFVTHFATKTLISHSVSPENVFLVRDFLERKYKLLLDALVSKKPGVLGVLQNFLYRRLEAIGVNQWNQAVGSQGSNDYFFVEHRGVVQQELLSSYYPFMVDIHNKEYHRIKFDGSEFEVLTLKMLGFEAGSVVGYEAAMMTSAALVEQLVSFEDVVSRLLRSNNPAHLFFLNLITSVYAYMDPAKTNAIMQTVKTTIVPHLVSYGANPERMLGGVLGVAVLDFASSRQPCEAILDLVSKDVKRSGCDTRVHELTGQLVNCVFHPNIETVTFLLDYVVRSRWLEDDVLSPCATDVFAAAFVRNASVLNGAISSLDNYERILQDVKQKLTKHMYAKRDNMIYQTVWNRFMASAFKTPKIRYCLIKILTGGLLQSNNVNEYALEFRRLLVELLRAYVTDTGIDYNHFTVEEAMRETEPKYVKGKGEKWISQPHPPKSP